MSLLCIFINFLKDTKVASAQNEWKINPNETVHKKKFLLVNLHEKRLNIPNNPELSTSSS